MTDMEHKRNKAKKLTDGNERSYGELVQATGGRFSMDTSDFRRELFISHLVKWGIITEEQKLDFDIAFLEEVESQLENAWTEFRKMRDAPKLMVPNQQTPKLIDSSGRPLT